MTAAQSPPPLTASCQAGLMCKRTGINVVRRMTCHSHSVKHLMRWLLRLPAAYMPQAELR